MKLKTYFAGTVAAAMSQAVRELGPEAMLIQSKRALPEARHRGEYEVVFGLEANEENGVATAAAPPALPGNSGWGSLARDVAELRRQLERTTSAIARAASWSSLAAAPPEIARFYSGLIDAGVDVDVAHDVAGSVAKQPNTGGSNGLEEIAKRFRTDSSQQAIMAVCGPPGAGKTSVLVKIAARCAMTSRRPLQILSIDNYRIGGCEQLRMYASILGAGFEFLETVPHLDHALSDDRRRGLILIDTPGYGPHDADAAWDLARYLSKREDIDKHLVLSASMKNADLSAAVDRFENFRPQKLLFTRIDETSTYGGLLNQAARTGKPLSFLSRGQRIPEDLEPATPESVARLLYEPGGEMQERKPVAA